MSSFVLLLATLVPLAGWSHGAVPGTKDQDLFNQGKIAIFDQNWEAARGIFQRVIAEYPQSSLVPQAYYFIARCFRFQGKDEEAFRAYGVFLQKYPNEPFLAGEARNSVVELAASLSEKGDSSHRDVLISALKDPNKDVRYFAAIRCSRLKDGSISALTVPILREIVRQSGERELADRARIALLRLDPKGLAENAEEPPKSKAAPRGGSSKSDQKMFHLRVYQAGASRPVIELNLPVSLAQMAVGALDESAKSELKKKGINVENIWESLNSIGPTNILTIRDSGNLIKLWIE